MSFGFVRVVSRKKNTDTLLWNFIQIIVLLIFFFKSILLIICVRIFRLANSNVSTPLTPRPGKHLRDNGNWKCEEFSFVHSLNKREFYLLKAIIWDLKKNHWEERGRSREAKFELGFYQHNFT